MTPLRTYHLPDIEPAVEPATVGELPVEHARVTPDELRAVIAAARQAAAARRQRRLDDVLSVLTEVMERWRSTSYSLRRLAEQVLPAATGFSAPMVAHGLSRILESLRVDALRALLDDELGDRRVLDDTHDGRRAIGPRLITHVLSGNIPALAAPSIVLSLALKSAVLVKPALGDPVFPALFATSIHEVDEELGRSLAVVHWRGGAAALEEVAFGADLVVASGSDAALAAIAPRVSTRFVGHGHKISFAAIGRECLAGREPAAALAHRLAYDVSLWDQHGCLSPQLCYIEAGGTVRAGEFAELLGAALNEWARSLPPRRLSLAEAAAVQRFRQEAEWEGAELLVSLDGPAWSVSVERDATFRPTCLHRCLRLKAVDGLEVLDAALAPHRRHLEAAGVAAGAARRARLAARLAACGVHRICGIGTMQLPPLSWRQGGRPRLADWVEWTGVEDAAQSHE